MVVDFADLPVNLRQEILNLIRNRNISSPTLTITGLGMLQPKVKGTTAPKKHDPVNDLPPHGPDGFRD